MCGHLVRLSFLIVFLLVSQTGLARPSSQNQNLLDAEEEAQSDPAKVMQLMMQQMQEMDKASDKLFENFFGEDSHSGPSFDDFDKLQQQFLNRLNQQTAPTPSQPKAAKPSSSDRDAPAADHENAEASAFGAQVTQQNGQNHVIMRVDVPGLDESSLNIRVENGFLHLSGNTRKVSPSQNDPSAVMLQENSTVHFEKILPLPDEADASKMDVKKNGDSIELVFAKLAPGK